MGGKKKTGKNENEGERSVKELSESLANQIQVLKWQIVMEQEKADRARAGQNECRNSLAELDTKFEEEKKRAYTVTAEMMGQYRSMVRDRDEKIEHHESELRERKDELSDKDRKLRELIRNKDKEIDDKDNEIRELRKKIDDMSQEFANMLKTTLDKMQERIELANTQWDTEVVESQYNR